MGHIPASPPSTTPPELPLPELLLPLLLPELLLELLLELDPPLLDELPLDELLLEPLLLALTPPSSPLLVTTVHAESAAAIAPTTTNPAVQATFFMCVHPILRKKKTRTRMPRRARTQTIP